MSTDKRDAYFSPESIAHTLEPYRPRTYMHLIEHKSRIHAAAARPPVSQQPVPYAATGYASKPVEVAGFFEMVNNIVALWYGPVRWALKDSAKENDERTRHARTAD